MICFFLPSSPSLPQVYLGVSKPSRRLRRIMGKTLIETHVKASKVVDLLSPGKPTTPTKAAESGDADLECAEQTPEKAEESKKKRRSHEHPQFVLAQDYNFVKKSSRIDDEKMCQILEDHSKLSCRYSQRHECAFRTLDKSLKKIWRQEKQLNVHLCYSAVAKQVRIRNPRLPFSKATKRVDICKICRCWDTVVSKELLHELSDAFEAFQGFLPNYFDKSWRATCKERGWTVEGFDKEASPEWLEALIAYVRSHATQHHDARANLKVASLQSLETVEHMLVGRLEALLPEVREYAGHWSLRNTLDDALRRDKQHPEENTVYILSDWKDSFSFQINPNKHSFIGC